MIKGTGRGRSKSNLRILRESVILFPVLLSTVAAAQITKELHFKVGPKPLVSITNDYGSISVQPPENDKVMVTTLAPSDAVRFSSEQHSNRIELRAESNFRGGEVVDYRVWVPTDSVVSVRCSEGKVTYRG